MLSYYARYKHSSQHTGKLKFVIKYILTFSFFFLLYPIGPKAQVNELDSLKTALANSPDDTSKVNLLLELGSNIDPLRMEEALAYNEEANKLAEHLKFRIGQGYALKNIGLIYFYQGDYDEVRKYWQQSLDKFRQTEDSLGVSNLLSNLGAIFSEQGNHKKALEYYLESLGVSQYIGNKLRIATALNNIGIVYFNFPVNHDKAKEYYLRALPISEEIGDPFAISTSSVNLSEIYFEKGKLDSAEYFNQKALTAIEGASGIPSYVEIFTLINIGKVHAAQNEFKEAIAIQHQAYDRAVAAGGRLEIIKSLNGLGNSYLARAKEENDRVALDTAAFYLEKAVAEAAGTDFKPDLSEALKGLYTINKLKENRSEALRYFEWHHDIKDTLINEENIKSLALLGAEYEFAKEKEDLERDLETQLRRQRSIQFATAGGLFFALIFIAIIVQYYRLKRISTSEKFEAQRQLIMQDKLASLGQITAGIAHEIKNPLNFVANFAEGSLDIGEELVETIEENKEKLDNEQYDLLLELADDLNENAKVIQENGLRADRVVKRMMEQARGDKGEPQKIDINTLVDENIQLAYHGYRGNTPGFDVSIEKNYGLNLSPVEVIPQDIGRVILNIINNACYALHEKQRSVAGPFSPKIKVSTTQEKDQTVIRIFDNGPGIPKDIQKKIFQPFFTTKPTGKGNTGLGLSISHDLVVIGHHGDMKVKSSKGAFTEFIIKLPVNRPANIIKVA